MSSSVSLYRRWHPIAYAVPGVRRRRPREIMVVSTAYLAISGCPEHEHVAPLPPRDRTPLDVSADGRCTPPRRRRQKPRVTLRAKRLKGVVDPALDGTTFLDTLRAPYRRPEHRVRSTPRGDAHGRSAGAPVECRFVSRVASPRSCGAQSWPMLRVPIYYLPTYRRSCTCIIAYYSW